jgi:uncharacterized phiE125 gp8 family phage protein
MHVVRPDHTAGTNVVPLADAKEFLRVDSSDEDATITALLRAAVAWVEDYCNRSFTAGSSAVFHLERWRTAALAYGPVTAITHVKYNDTAGAEQTLAASKYYTTAATDGGMLIYFHDTPDLETYNAQPVRVTAAVGVEESANVKHAVKMLVAHWYENRRAVVTGTITATIPIAVESLLSVERIIDNRQ